MAEPVVRWSYLGGGATCDVTFGGRTERWTSSSIYVTPHERLDVPKMLEDRIKATIRLFGPVVEEDYGG
jgi:hypothetical protein